MFWRIFKARKEYRDFMLNTNLDIKGALNAGIITKKDIDKIIDDIDKRVKQIATNHHCNLKKAWELQKNEQRMIKAKEAMKNLADNSLDLSSREMTEMWVKQAQQEIKEGKLPKDFLDWRPK